VFDRPQAPSRWPHLQQGRRHPEIVLSPSGDVRGHHLRADRRRVRRAHQVLAVLMFMTLWFTFSYAPMAHMVWYWMA